MKYMCRNTKHTHPLSSMFFFSSIWTFVLRVALNSEINTMKASLFLLKWARSPQNPDKVPFKVDLPLRLRNQVTGKGTFIKEKGCLHEISLLLTCLQKNNYQNNMCNHEVTNFKDCYRTYLKNTEFHKEEAHKGNLTPGAKNLRYRQINKLLAKYPQINS